MRQVSTIVVAAGTLLMAASARPDPLPGFTFVAETEHFSFYSQGTLRIDVGKRGMSGHTIRKDSARP